MMEFPLFVQVKQKFCDDKISDVETEVLKQINEASITIHRGDRIAIAVGSRGISNINLITRSVVNWVKTKGGEPFIIPAMGSHGNGIASEQKKILESLGVTEEFIGAPIKSSMDVVELPNGDLDNRVYMDRNAYEADGTIVINRIKIHGDFSGDTESGLIKMCVIGLGKHRQALEIHKYDISRIRELLLGTARQVLLHGNVILGIGIVENAYHETMIIRALLPRLFEQEESKLLRRYKEIMPRFPVKEFDILIVDEIGKEISGAGMETKIVGRLRSGSEEPEFPCIRFIIASDLTDISHGNACGVGIADFITRRLFDKIDLDATNENVITCRCIEQGKIPIITRNDAQALEYAIRAMGNIAIPDLRIIRIKNTLRMDEIYVTPNLLHQVEKCANVSFVDGNPVQILDRNTGNLIPFEKFGS